MKKKFSIFMIFCLLFGLLIPIHAATVEFNTYMDSGNKELTVTGSCSSPRNLTVYITDNTEENIYAIDQFATEADGTFTKIIRLGEDFAYGSYKVVIGGLGYGIAEGERSANFEYRSLDDFSLWLEAENAVLSGNYTTVGAAQSSGSARIAVDTVNTSTNNTAVFNFAVPAGAVYDVWVLSTPGNVTYTSKYMYSFDGEDGRYNFNNNMEVLYTTNDVRKAEMGWSKLTSQYLSNGGHTLTFACNTRRELNNDFIYHVLDTVVIVPEYWGWEPNGFYKPYYAENVKMNCTSASSRKTELSRGDSVDVIIYASLEEEIEYDITLWAAMLRNGEVVSQTVAQPPTATSKWKAGRKYISILTLSVPGFAPTGEYEIVCGIGSILQCGFYNTDGFANVGTVTVGKKESVVPDKVTISSAELKQTGDNISVLYTLSDTNTDKSSKAYLKLWRDDVLWGVAEAENKTSLAQNSAEQILTLPEGIPEGHYRAELGFYNVNGNYTIEGFNIESQKKFGYKPLSNGVYKSQKTGREHFWYVNQENALIWDGEPYIPMGGMETLSIITNYSSNKDLNETYWAIDKAELDLLAEKGVRDLYINAVAGSNIAPRWVWEYVLEYIDSLGIHYSVQTNLGVARFMDVFYIRSNPSMGAITVTGIKRSGTVRKTAALGDVDTYGTSEPKGALYALINSSGETVAAGNCTLNKTNGGYEFSAEITLPKPGTYSVSFTPLVNKINSIMCNFWDYREEILDSALDFASIPMGDNVRSIIDPLGNETGYYNGLESIRPYSENYNRMFADWLKEKYTDISKLNDAWQTASGIAGFETAARIIPIYTSPQADSYYVYGVDPDTERVYRFDGRKGVMWNDFLNFRDESTADFYNDTADAYKETLDVPVVIKNVWGHREYFKNREMSGGIDGLGSEAYGSYARIANLQTSTYGIVNQFAKTAWLIVTETNTEEDILAKFNSGQYGYESESNMHGQFDTLLEYGAKGIFDFLFSARHDAITHTTYSYINKPEQFDWLNNYIANLDEAAVAEYIPPKNKVYLMPHNSNYYTRPNRYTSVLYDDSYRAPRESFASGNMMLMMSEDVRGAEIAAANFENAPASVYQGKLFGELIDNTAPEQQLVYLGMRNDLGTVPQLDKYFTGRFAYYNGVKVQILNPTTSAEIIKTTADGRPWAIRDGNLWIVAAEDCISDYSVKYLDEIGIFMDSESLVLRDYRIEDAEGNEADILKNGVYTVKLQIKNNEESFAGALYAAAYDKDGRLTKVVSDSKKIMNGLNALEASLEISDKDFSLKCFVWNDRIEPITELVSILRK